MTFLACTAIGVLVGFLVGSSLAITACQRSDLTPVEKARAMGRLQNEEGYTQAQIATSTGLSAATVSYHLALLDLDASTQQRVIDGTVSVGVARAAVRQTRAKAAKAKGYKPRPQVKVDPDHFTRRHPLADEVRVMCELEGHTGRKLGRDASAGFGCGVCWEAVIRRDERRQVQAENRQRAAAQGKPVVPFRAAEVVA